MRPRAAGEGITGLLKRGKGYMLKIKTTGNTPSVSLTNCYKGKVVTSMNEKLMKYLDGIFSPYENLKSVKELKEELFNNLQEKMSDLKAQGYDDETAYQMTIDSIGDISEIIGNISAGTRELLE